MRIMLVDDNRDFCQSLADILELEGYEVSMAFDGPTALETFSQASPDVLLLDTVMSGLEGLEILRGVREIAPRVPVVMITGYPVEDVADKMRQQGVQRVMQKPLDFEELFRLLKTFEVGCCERNSVAAGWGRR